MKTTYQSGPAKEIEPEQVPEIVISKDHRQVKKDNLYDAMCVKPPLLKNVIYLCKTPFPCIYPVIKTYYIDGDMQAYITYLASRHLTPK